MTANPTTANPTLARPAAIVSAATLASRVLGFARDLLIAAAFGAGAVADAFLLAFQLLNLARRLLAEGALNTALVPLYLRARDEGGPARAAAVAGQITGTLIVMLFALATIFALAMPWLVLVFAPGFAASEPRHALAVEFARLMLPYLVIAGPLAVLAAVLNANRRFVATSYGPLVFNLCLMAVLAVVLLREKADAALVAGAVGVAGLCQLVLIGWAVARGKDRATPLAVSFGPPMRRFLAVAAPGLIANALPQLTLLAAVMVASSSPHAISWIYYANRLIELPLGVVAVAAGTVLLPAFAQANRSTGSAAFLAAQSRGLELALGLALPAMVGLAVLSDPIVRVLLQRGAFTSGDVAATAAALTALALGLPGHVVAKIFAAAFFAREQAAVPLRVALLGVATALLAGFALMPWLGHVGVALAVALSGWISAALLVMRMARAGFSLDRDARRRLPRIAAAALGMGVGLAVAERILPSISTQTAVSGALGLAALLAGGVAAYLAFLHLFGVASPSALLSALRRSA